MSCEGAEEGERRRKELYNVRPPALHAVVYNFRMLIKKEPSA
jgi:hypothetical protein